LARRVLKQSLVCRVETPTLPTGENMHDDESRRIGIRALRGIAELRAKVDFGDRTSNALDALAIARTPAGRRNASRGADHVIP